MKRLLAILLLCGVSLSACARKYPDQRPAAADRLFVSEAVEATIARIAPQLTHPKLRWMFRNCFPNTLDTTVHFDKETGLTFVYTGDIPAMWLRDSGAQVWPYVALCPEDAALQAMVAGVIRQQLRLLCIDPYANAFNQGPTGDGAKDDTGSPQSPWVFERKWEVDSPCYVIRLAHHYWKVTGDASVFDAVWVEAVGKVLDTFREQQRKEGNGSYYFLRVTDRQLDTKDRRGWGNPVNPVGLICSSFRPSDDATQFEFLVPSNFFAVQSLRQAAEILAEVNREDKLAGQCTMLAAEVEKALQDYAVVHHPTFGDIYAFEVDGIGNAYLMDDANVPSLLSLAYLIPGMADDPVYQNTRRFVWSESNPYFWRGKAGEGIGGPHIGTEAIWPMSIMMKAFTARSDDEIRACLEQLLRTDAGTGFIHESFERNDASDFTRPWFAWQNTLFGELVLHLFNSGKLDVLNSVS